MKVRNLQSWAGENFSYLPDEVIELPDAVALARIEAGLVESVTGEQGELPLDAPAKSVKKAKV